MPFGIIIICNHYVLNDKLLKEFIEVILFVISIIKFCPLMPKQCMLFFWEYSSELALQFLLS